MNAKVNYLGLLVGVLFFLDMRPYFTWAMSSMSIVVMTLVLTSVLAIKVDLRAKGKGILFAFFLTILLMDAIIHGKNLFGFLPVGMLVFIPFMNTDFAKEAYSYFEKILVVVTAASIAMWFLVVVFGVNFPYSVIGPLNELKEIDYSSYAVLVVPNVIDADIGRFCCVFDEPGVVGTYSMIILYVNKFDFSKIKNVIILLSGVISFSLFFYVATALFLITKIFIRKELKKYRWVSIISVVLLFVLLQNIPFLNEIIGYRFQYDKSDKRFVGDNRSGEDLDDYIESIRGTSTYFWGASTDIQKEYSMHAGLGNAILRFGIVFIVCYFVFFFFFAKNQLRKQWKEVLVFMLILFLTLYQRPGLLVPHYLFLFTLCVVNHVELDEKAVSLPMPSSNATLKENFISK